MIFRFFRTPNPTVPEIANVETAARSFLIGTQKTLRNAEIILRRNAAVRERIDRDGGLANILTRSTDQDVERSYLTSFVNLQESLFIDRVTNSDFDRTPSLEEMNDGIKGNSGVLTAIKSELEDCCEIIKSKIDNLRIYIGNKFQDQYDHIENVQTFLRDRISESGSNLERVIKEQFEEIKNLFTVIDNDLTQLFEKYYGDLLQRYRDIYTVLNGLFSAFNDFNDYFRGDFENTTNNIFNNTQYVRSKIESLEGDLLNQIDIKLQNLLRNFIDYYDPKFVTLEGTIKSQIEASIVSLQRELIIVIEGAIAPVIETITTAVTTFLGTILEINVALGIIGEQIAAISSSIRSLPENIKGLIDKRFDEFAERIRKEFEDFKKDLKEEIAEEVSLSIVGESYYKWDGTNVFYPTLTLLFKEINASQYPRKSQIKLRIEKDNEEITDEDVKKIKENCRTLKGCKYLYGQQRYNYVWGKKRFKTTVFGAEKTDIVRLFNKVFETIGPPFEQKNLSVTIDRTRENISKRQTSLAGVEINNVNYKDKFEVEFYKAVLMVNGIKKPILVT